MMMMMIMLMKMKSVAVKRRWVNTWFMPAGRDLRLDFWCDDGSLKKNHHEHDSLFDKNNMVISVIREITELKLKISNPT